MQIPKQPAEACEEPLESEEKEPGEKERSYYYDDAHGYEDYDPGETDDEPE